MQKKIIFDTTMNAINQLFVLRLAMHVAGDNSDTVETAVEKLAGHLRQIRDVAGDGIKIQDVPDS